MTDRIFIGKKDGNQLLRISKPGFDVNNKANPMIFSSENNYLKIHYRNTIQLSKYNQDDYTFWYGSDTFPSLPYYPLIWYHYRSPQLESNAVRFPVPNADVFWSASCASTMNKVWFSSSNWRDFSSANVFVEYVVFNVSMS